MPTGFNDEHRVLVNNFIAHRDAVNDCNHYSSKSKWLVKCLRSKLFGPRLFTFCIR